ncbi:cobalamin biosynthesis protein CbiX [Betaproteobacteria bacterium]|nr:cobalamin biosynthesis protein CbiX [Betaproteobacteria bacterium]GHU42287.1 cobalamin biosynthesis protein CbiX [Betaproteobacteria bacterium]
MVITAPTRALILLGHGARDEEWALPLQNVQARIRAAHPAFRVELAFLDFIAPDLPTRVAELATAGMAHIIILPMFIAAGGHLKRDLPKQVAALQADYPQLHFELAETIGMATDVQAAMAREAMRYLA